MAWLATGKVIYLIGYLAIRCFDTLILWHSDTFDILKLRHSEQQTQQTQQTQCLVSVVSVVWVVPVVSVVPGASVVSIGSVGA